MQSNKKVLVLEGNIGAGKSTFLKVLKNNLNVDIVFEPTNKWQDVESEGNILDLFYKDIKRWAYTFQSYAFISRVQSQIDEEKNCKTGVQIFERSVYCDRYCFAKNCYESGHMTALEWQIYKEWFGWLVERYTQQPNGFIYLQTDPQTCFKRLQKRNRSEETGVGIDYLELLHNKHEDWLIKKEGVKGNIASVPVLTLDCNNDFESNLDVQKAHIQKVYNFIQSLDNLNIPKIDKTQQIQV